MESVYLTKDKYLEIYSSVQKAEAKVNIIRESRSHIEETKSAFEDQIQSLVSVSEENSVITQNVQESVKIQSLAIENILAEAQGLEMLSDKLKKLISIFKV